MTQSRWTLLKGVLMTSMQKGGYEIMRMRAGKSNLTYVLQNVAQGVQSYPATSVPQYATARPGDSK